MSQAPWTLYMELENEVKDDGLRKQANRDKRAAKIRRIKADREELDQLRKRGPPADLRPGGQGKGRGKGKSKDHAGSQICYIHTQTGRAFVELQSPEGNVCKRSNGPINASIVYHQVTETPTYCPKNG